MRTLGFSAALLIACVSFAQKKPLDDSVYDGWKSIQQTTLSRDGKWIAFAINPQEGDNVVHVKSTDGSKTYSFDRGTGIRISQDGKFLVATIVPKAEDVKKAVRDKVKPEDRPKNSLLIMNLETGQKREIEKVVSWSLAVEDQGWLVYKLEPPKPEPAKPAEGKPAEEKPAEAKPQEPKKPEKKKDHRPGEQIVLLNLATGQEQKIEDVVSFQFNREGNALAYTLSTKDGSGDGVVYYDLATGQKTPVVTQLGKYPRLALTEDGSRLAFTTDKDDYAAAKPLVSIYLFGPSTGQTQLVAKEGSAGIPQGWVVAESGAISFTESGNRLRFATVPKPEEEKKDETPAEEKAEVDIWSWTDDRLQPMQLLQLNQDRNRTYEAIYNINGGRIVQVETPTLRSVIISDEGDGNYGLGTSDDSYLRQSSWDLGHSDVYIVDIRTGESRKVVENLMGNAMLSETGKYVIVLDDQAQEVYSINTATGAKADVATDIPFPIWDELNDLPYPAGSYGGAGWTANDDRFVLYDNYDMWLVDPAGKAASVNLTEGFGRSMKIRYRYVSTDPEEQFIPTDRPILLRAFNDESKAAGFAWEHVGKAGFYPKQILMADKMFSNPGKARDAETIYFTQMDFVEYPDLWLADNLNFENRRKISDANPQQKEYNWGTAEMVTWRSLEGERLQGVLFKPENFDPAKKYPMITYFYERSSDTIHAYRTPAPSASTVNISMYVSQGYLVFMPDIPYKVGYPGESAVAAIVPGVNSIVERGIADPKRLAIQGQSWGGYQVAYLITETNMFAAACAGAPVANMFSAYGGIRWGSGMSRAFQYEQTQSRIGASIWDAPLRYLENSPIFFADKVKTPLLMMHNDKDGAVPWYQGIEYFTALRRLNKPVWLAVYNNEDHNLVQRKNRKDWSIRMQQFFDHYLKGAPMPKWMAEGVPAINKGKDYGFDLVGDKKGGG